MPYQIASIAHPKVRSAVASRGSTIDVRVLGAGHEVDNLDEAVDYATATTGKAIIFTASTMIAGTVFWWFAHLKFLSEMGFLLALLMAFNTVGGLIAVPAFVKVLRPAVLVRRRS